jgi:hypothetical protein
MVGVQHLISSNIKVVREIFAATKQKGPNVGSFTLYFQLLTFTDAVTKESTKQTAVRMMNHLQQKRFVELKSRWKLSDNLKHSIQPLKENRTYFVWNLVTGMSTPVGELVTKLQPLSLHQHNETLYCPVIWVKKKFRQRYELCRSIPSV